MFKKFNILFGALIIILILLYFFWPTTFKESKLQQDIIIHKYADGIPYDYLLNEQEVNELVEIINKSKDLETLGNIADIEISEAQKHILETMKILIKQGDLII